MRVPGKCFLLFWLFIDLFHVAMVVPHGLNSFTIYDALYGGQSAQELAVSTLKQIGREKCFLIVRQKLKCSDDHKRFVFNFIMMIEVSAIRIQGNKLL